MSTAPGAQRSAPADHVDDPFEVLGIAACFRLEPAALRAAWLTQISAVHPDHAPGPRTVLSPGRAAARLNAAFGVLQDDARRAEALLRRLGGASAAEDTALPKGFLVEVLGIRSDLDTAVAAGDADGICRVRAWAFAYRTACVERIASLFDADADADAGAGVLVGVRAELNVLRYVERMLDQIRGACGRLGVS